MTIVIIKSGFLELNINSPQMRCQLAEQVRLQMSSEHGGERVADRRAVGRQFQMTGPTAPVLACQAEAIVDLGRTWPQHRIDIH